MSALESALLRAAGFRHGFSIRPWDFRVASGGAGERQRSEEAIALLLRLPRERLFRVSQVHGARAIRATGDVDTLAKEEADALVTREPRTAVSVRVADCAPILLASSTTGEVAAVHAGWRGVVAHVIDAAFRLGERGPGAFDLAAIGPCIGVCCFEIGDDVAAKLAPHVRDRHGDLRAAVRAQLRACGLDDSRIDDVPGCTRCDADRFFSHRRDGDAAGRHLAVIATRD